ncbi:coiled-coil domain-containing protein 134 [Calliopsis andreniformis]|uniref:coiled-coil domain-containing protein 134 n=1 Tax=Calliopsis andreniformis TaxID=337506 RepID=UPI003FCE8746
MPRVFIYIVAVSVLTCIAHAQQTDASITEDRINGEPRNSSSSKIEVYEELFKKSFSHVRKEHAKAIHRLQRVDSYERLYKMITVLCEKMVDVIETSKPLIENAGFDPDNRSLPQNVTLQSALSTVLENTALFSDIVLHFPHVTHRILKSQQKWNVIIDWFINFTNRSRHFLDKETITRIHLVAQELNITEREAGYFNPYWQPDEFRETKEEVKGKKAKKKEKRKRGPQMAKIEL